VEVFQKFPNYEEIYTPSEEFNDKGFLILNQNKSGFCQVCQKEHDSVGAYLFVKGEEQTILGCFLLSGT